MHGCESVSVCVCVCVRMPLHVILHAEAKRCSSSIQLVLCHVFGVYAVREQRIITDNFMLCMHVRANLCDSSDTCSERVYIPANEKSAIALSTVTRPEYASNVRFFPLGCLHAPLFVC